MPMLVIMRHGETISALENRFAGWADTALSSGGETEVIPAAKAISRLGIVFDRCYSSRLIRAQKSAKILRDNGVRIANETIADWRLNERHYGSLQGLKRSAVIEKFGSDQTLEWRRSFTAIPPELNLHDDRWHDQLRRFPDVDPALLPRSESIRTAAERVRPVWQDELKPMLLAQQNLLVVAHTSSIRGIVRIIENLDDTATASFRIATSVPIVYDFSSDLKSYNKYEITTGIRSVFRYALNRFKPRRLAGF